VAKGAKAMIGTPVDTMIERDGLLGATATLTGDQTISHVALAFWPDEASGAEKAFGELGARLLTGGFVGNVETMSFGVVALSAKRFWRVKLGQLRVSGLDLDTDELIRGSMEPGHFNSIVHVPLKRALVHFSEQSQGCRIVIGPLTRDSSSTPFGSATFVDDLSLALGIKHRVFSSSKANLKCAREIGSQLVASSKSLTFPPGIDDTGYQSLVVCSKCDFVSKQVAITCPGCGHTNKEPLVGMAIVSIGLAAAGVAVSNAWSWLLFALAGLLAALAIHLFLQMKKVQKRLKRPASKAHAPAELQHDATRVSFTCSACNARLQAKKTPPPKRIKCPKCSAVVTVPTFE
jgi:hypothetical protein